MRQRYKRKVGQSVKVQQSISFLLLICSTSLILKIRQKYTEISFPARNLISKTAFGCPKIHKIEVKVRALMALFVSEDTYIECTAQKRTEQPVEI